MHYHRMKDLGLSMVEQAPFVFNLTLGENLSLGLDYRSEEMEVVLQGCRIDEFADQNL